MICLTVNSTHQGLNSAGSRVPTDPRSGNSILGIRHPSWEIC